MAKEFVYVPVQTVQPGQDVLLENNSTSSNCGCSNSQIFHESGSGIITLSAPRCGNACNKFAEYSVIFNANIAVPATETPGEISLTLTQNGEQILSSQSIATPTAVDAYGNVTVAKLVRVPKVCGCIDIAIKNTSTIPVNVQNVNVTVVRES